ncbi:hypothetical protein PG637_05650 [Riemerella anatipestifer]|nr:hypothetical protein [Riemerella anatipestifer]MDY3325155.1 hypothetical protein [Riemerella anatipestifer]MDY3352856.1 hypothetical protein [Riemerella anatipestifer]
MLNLNIADELDFEIETYKKSTTNKAQYAIEKTKEFLNNYQGNKENIAFYLTGNAKSIANLRNTLTKLGINQKNTNTNRAILGGRKTRFVNLDTLFKSVVYFKKEVILANIRVLNLSSDLA